jgi:lipooligosaccharide transport system permease protein
MLRVVEREVQIFRRVWHSTLFSSFVSPVLYLAAMGLGLGALVDRRGHVEGLTYLVFVAPGLLVASAMQMGAVESLWPVLGGMKWMRTSHAMVATPVRATDVYGGFLIWIALRTFLSSSAFLLVAVLLGGVSSRWGFLAVPAAMLGALAFAAPLGAYTATVDTDQAFPTIMRVGVLPLFLFSGTFFPVSQFPAWLRPASYASPLWHAVELARSATTGRADPAAIAVHLAVLCACVAAGAWWGVRTFTARLTQ